MPIPPFDADGYLPPGLHLATEAEVRARLGLGSRRQNLIDRVSVWLALCRAVGATRFLLDGSFVTAKSEPDDVDAVCWLAGDFEDRVRSGEVPAIRLYSMLVTREPEELFGVVSVAGWTSWELFFSRTREPDGRHKGLVEVIL